MASTHLAPRSRAAAELRAVVVLRDVYGLPHEAIADELGISVAAAKVRLHRGRKKLRDVLLRGGGTAVPMQCDEIAALLPGAVDGPSRSRCRSRRHVESLPALPGRARPATASCCGRSSMLRTEFSSPPRACSPRPSPASTRRASAAPCARCYRAPDRLRRRDRRRARSPPPAHGRRVARRPRPPPRAAARRLTPRPGERPPEAPLLSWRVRPPTAPEGSSSIGRAPVSKTGGWGFESLLPCSHTRTPVPRLVSRRPTQVTMNRQTKRHDGEAGRRQAARARAQRRRRSSAARTNAPARVSTSPRSAAS